MSKGRLRIAMCDGAHCLAAEGEVRLYPIGDGRNLVLCFDCWQHENARRGKQALETGAPKERREADWLMAKIYPDDLDREWLLRNQAINLAGGGTPQKPLQFRLDLIDELGEIVGEEKLEAEGDRDAMVIAKLLCDACSDVCAGFELWRGRLRVDISYRDLAAASVENFAEKMQETVIWHEERLRASQWAVGQSRRLLEQTQLLAAEAEKRCAAGV